MGVRVLRVERDGATEHLAGDLEVVAIQVVLDRQTAQHAVVGAEAVGRTIANARDFGLAHARIDRGGDARSDLILEREQVLVEAVVAFGPDLAVGGGVDQHRMDAQALPVASNRSFQEIANAKGACNVGCDGVVVAVFQRRVAGDHEQRMIEGKRSDDLLDHAVAEIGAHLGALAAKGQDGHRRPVFPVELDLGKRRVLADIGEDPEYPQRTADVLEPPFAEILKRQRQLVPDEVAYRLRDHDLVRFGRLVNARSDVDAIAEKLVVLDDDILDADPDAHADRRPALGSLVGQPPLGVDRPSHRVDGAGEFEQDGVACDLDEATAELVQMRPDQIPLDRPLGRGGGQGVGLDERRPARDVGECDRGQPAHDSDRRLHERPVLHRRAQTLSHGASPSARRIHKANDAAFRCAAK